MIGSSLAFAEMNAFVKTAGNHVPFFQVVFARSFFMLLAVVPLALWRGEKLLGNNRSILFTRGIAGFLALTLGFYVTTHMNLANASVLNNTAAFFAPILSALFLKERTTRRFWLYVLLAFIGVVFVAKPDFGVMNLVGLLGLLSGLFAAVAYVSMRKLHSTDTGLTIVANFAFWASLCSLILGGANFVWPTGGEWAHLVGIGFCGTVGQVLLTNSFRYATASVVSPFIYMIVPFSTLLGFILWREVPDLLSIIGGAIIIFCGVAITRLAHRREQAPAAVVAPVPQEA
jgi:drug/metabolite transporter (DMT)-like permease